MESTITIKLLIGVHFHFSKIPILVKTTNQEKSECVSVQTSPHINLPMHVCHMIVSSLYWNRVISNTCLGNGLYYTV